MHPHICLHVKVEESNALQIQKTNYTFCIYLGTHQLHEGEECVRQLLEGDDSSA